VGLALGGLFFLGCFTQRPPHNAADDDIFADGGDVLVDELLDADAVVADVGLAQQDEFILVLVEGAFHDAGDDGIRLAFFARLGGRDFGFVFQNIGGDVFLADVEGRGGSHLQG